MTAARHRKTRGPARRAALPALALLAAAALAPPASAQPGSPHDLGTYDLAVLTPAMKQVSHWKDLTYRGGDGKPLRLDLYLPQNAPVGARLPAVILLNGTGDSPSRRWKETGQFRGWARLAAAAGYAGITYDARQADPVADLRSLIAQLSTKEFQKHVDAERLAVVACGENVAGAAALLAPRLPAVKAAVFLYGAAEIPDYPRDLPVFLVRPGRDAEAARAAVDRMAAGALAAGAPWTVVGVPSLPRAFDVLSETPESRRVVLDAMSFIRVAFQVPPPAPSPAPDPAREALTYLQAGETERAAEAYAAIVKAQPGDGIAWRQLGLLQRELGRLEEACASLEEAVRNGAGTPPVQYELARLYASLGDPEKALDALTKAVDGGFRDARRLSSDEDFVDLYADERFRSLVTRAGS